MNPSPRPAAASGARRTSALFGATLLGATVLCAAALPATDVHAQDCAQASQDFNALNGAPVRDRQAMERAARAVTAACGEQPGQAPLSALPEPTQPQRSPPGPFVRCDKAGCWGSANNVRYRYVDGGNLQGADGSYCARGPGKSYACN